MTTTIDFEDQPAGPEEYELAGPMQTLIYDIGGGQTATFTGGVILTNEGGGVDVYDDGNVYGTISTNLQPGAGPGLTNPLTVTFSAPVANFVAQVCNALGTTFDPPNSGYYKMTNNLGDVVYGNVVNSAAAVNLSLPASASVFNVYYLTESEGPVNNSIWDFVFGQVSFGPPTPPSPPPRRWLAQLGPINTITAG